jgi:hypothetical protein
MKIAVIVCAYSVCLHLILYLLGSEDENEDPNRQLYLGAFYLIQGSIMCLTIFKRKLGNILLGQSYFIFSLLFILSQF